MEIKQIKYLGEQAISYLVEKCKATFALITHTHTPDEIGADAKGSASAALSLSNEYTDQQIATITSGNTVVKESTHSSTADSATNAAHATTADEAGHATLADMATSAAQDADGNVITEVYETKTDASAKLIEAKDFATAASVTIKNDLVNGATEGRATLKELSDLIDENKTSINEIESLANNKADVEHNHDDIYYTETETDLKIQEVKDYTDLIAQEMRSDSEFITIDELAELNGVTVEVRTENDNSISRNIIFNREFHTTKILKLYEDKAHSYIFYAESSDGTRTQVKSMLTGYMDEVTYITFKNSYYAKLDQYKYDILIMTSYNSTSIVSTTINFNEDTGDYVKHESDSLCSTSVVLYNANLNSSSESYSPVTDTDLATKSYVDTIVSNVDLSTYATEEYVDNSIVAIPSDVYVVTITGDDANGYTADRTYDELLEAYNNGKALYAVYNNTIFWMRSYSTGSFGMFNFIYIQVVKGGATTHWIFVGTNSVNYMKQSFDQDTVATINTNNSLNTTDKTLVGAINELNTNKVNQSDVESTYETKTDATAKLEESKSYTDTAVANLVNSAPETLDTIGELATAFNENQEVVDALNAAITNKADAVHVHEITDVTGLEEDLAEINVSLANKSDSDHNHDTVYYTQTQIDEMELITLDEIDEICGSVTEGSMLESDVDELMAKLEG